MLSINRISSFFSLTSLSSDFIKRKSISADGGAEGAAGGAKGLGLNFLDGFQEAFIGKRFFKIVIDIVLEGVESVFGLGGGEYDLGRVGQAVQEMESIGTGHLYVQEDEVGLLLVEEFQRIGNVEEMSFYVDKA